MKNQQRMLEYKMKDRTVCVYRQSLLERIENVSNVVRMLPSESPLRSAWDDIVMTETKQRVIDAVEADLGNLKLPPLFFLLDGISPETINALVDDLNIVSAASEDRRDPLTTASIKAPMDDRKWCGALFEVYVKSIFQKFVSGTSLDCPLPNGKDMDVRTILDGVEVFIECTVITDSDEDRAVFDRFMEYKKHQAEAVLTRPGCFDEKGSTGPGPYYDALRMYCKVYDKLAPQFDTAKSQTSAEHANILFLSFFTPRGSFGIDSPGVGWALDELFIAQPAGHIKLASCPGGVTGISLQDWLDYQQLSDPNAMLEIPCRLGALAMFNECTFSRSRVNYNANQENSIAHSQIAQIEQLFVAKPVWWSG